MSLLPKKYHAIPAFVPAAVAARLAGRRYRLDRLPEVVRRRMVTAEKIKISDHAARYRIVTDGPHVGPWRHEHAPHTVKIMDTYGSPWVSEVWFCGVEQSGKTNTMLNCMHWAADCDPGDIFYLMPTEDTANKVTGGKIKPMIQRSPRLSRYLTGRQDDVSLSQIRLAHGVTIRPAWANSPASMATWAAKHCFGDEIDKGTEMSGREADRVTLIRKRGRLYRGRSKRFFASTPAQLHIYKGTLACPQVWSYRLRCPHCDELIRPEGDHLLLDGLTVEDIEAGAKVELACHACGATMDDRLRERAIRAGRWLAIKGGELSRPRRVGFHHRAWDCLDVPLAEIAVAWLKQLKGTIADKVAWANGYEAMDYSQEQTDRDEDFILRLRDEAHPRKVVPRDTSMVLLFADTQQIGFHYEVIAFGWGEDLGLTMIDHGYVQSFANLKDLQQKAWLDADGKEFKAFCGFIDSGGGTNPHRPKHSRTVEVYQFCRGNPFWKPLKGRQTMETSWKVTRLDFYPSSVGKKVPIPGGLNLYTVNTTLLKNELSRKLQIEPGDPGAIKLHAETGGDYAKQMCAEYQDERGYWICPTGKDNHHWDIGVYAQGAIEILGLRNRRPDSGRQGRRVLSKGVAA